VVPHRQFADPESLSVGENRRKAVQFAIEPNVLYDLGPIRLEPAVEIMEGNAGNSAHCRVEEAARQGLPQRILAPLLPA
jgi:hypothetical protein